MIEHEVKLPYPDLEAARQAVLNAGGRLVLSRRLIEDRLFDTTDLRLRRAREALRVRRDGSRTYLTFKGPRLPGAVKSREEFETLVGDAATIEEVLAGLGLRQVFRSQKYREEYDADRVHIAVDETPAGVYVEIEAHPDDIDRFAVRLGRTPRDYALDSYPTLWRRWCSTHGLRPGDMLFGNRDPVREPS